jgi:hypothetical protein
MLQAQPVSSLAFLIGIAPVAAQMSRQGSKGDQFLCSSQATAPAVATRRLGGLGKLLVESSFHLQIRTRGHDGWKPVRNWTSSLTSPELLYGAKETRSRPPRAEHIIF